jgi:hypothetical protein
MPSLPLGQAVYERLDNPLIRLKNMYFETAPTNMTDAVSLTSRPGLSELISSGLGAGPVRGICRDDGSLSNTLFVVSGGSLYARTMTSGVITNLGAIAGSERVVMASNIDYVLIATGTLLYSTTATVLATVTVPDDAPVQSVAYLNNYFLILVDGQRVYFSDVGGITFDPLDYFSADSSPSDLKNIAVTGDELWMMGRSTTEVFAPTGNADLPFQRISGRVFPVGTYEYGRDAVVKTDYGIVWVGKDNIIYRSGSSPIPISDPTTEQAISIAALNSAQLYGWHYVVEGRSVYVLNVDDGEAGMTFAYDIKTGKWTQYGSYTFPMWNVWSSARYFDSSYFVGDISAGKVWRVDPSITLDGDQPMICEFTGELELNTPLRCNSVILDCSTGIGQATYPDDDPTIQLRTSNNRGKTYGSWLTTKLGRMGEYNTQVYWTRIGMLSSPGCVFHFRTAPPARFTVRKARYNDSTR